MAGSGDEGRSSAGVQGNGGPDRPVSAGLESGCFPSLPVRTGAPGWSLASSEQRPTHASFAGPRFGRETAPCGSGGGPGADGRRRRCPRRAVPRVPSHRASSWPRRKGMRRCESHASRGRRDPRRAAGSGALAGTDRGTYGRGSASTPLTKPSSVTPSMMMANLLMGDHPAGSCATVHRCCIRRATLGTGRNPGFSDGSGRLSGRKSGSLRGRIRPPEAMTGWR